MGVLLRARRLPARRGLHGLAAVAVIDPDYVLFGTELGMPDRNMHKLLPYLTAHAPIPKHVRSEIERSNQERDQAMTSMDREQILAYARKYGVDMNNLPATDERFWAAVHICISGVESLPMPMRKASKRWLIERGMPVFDDGKVRS